MQRYLSCLVFQSRLYSSQTSSVGKSQLIILRKRTGFPIIKCREALTKHNENVGAAESWLYSEAQKEGWTKVEKLKDRMTHQGLIGMLLRGNQAAMVEVLDWYYYLNIYSCRQGLNFVRLYKVNYLFFRHPNWGVWLFFFAKLLFNFLKTFLTGNIRMYQVSHTMFGLRGEKLTHASVKHGNVWGIPPGIWCWL